MPAWDEELEAAVAAARRGGRIALEWWRRSDLPRSRKPDGSLVTRADLDANDGIRSELQTRYPGDALLTEEGPHDAARLGVSRCWIADPIDGTSYFAAGRPSWAVLVAFAVDGAPVVGAVYYPATDRMWAAAAGGVVLSGSGAGPLAPLPTPRRPARLRIRYGKSAARLVEGLPDADTALLEQGTMDLIHLVTGAADGFVTLRTGASEWDVAATDLLIRVAGGRLTDAGGRPIMYNRHTDPRLPGGVLAAASAETHERLRILVV